MCKSKPAPFRQQIRDIGHGDMEKYMDISRAFWSSIGHLKLALTVSQGLGGIQSCSGRLHSSLPGVGRSRTQNARTQNTRPIRINQTRTPDCGLQQGRWEILSVAPGNDSITKRSPVIRSHDKFNFSQPQYFFSALSQFVVRPSRDISAGPFNHPSFWWTCGYRTRREMSFQHLIL